ncbi:LamG domain-containing protein (plasmid) [Mesorhizobium sp. AR02]|uniref:LamG-like jellyroll fold domain-containing protein n=1 Tax=Mesorhizobium sp. AR02 TaxID=2865837 RepID=UPI00220B4BFB|nr:LamG domain-containing protein [Mesorhizobium sp. AR02]
MSFRHRQRQFPRGCFRAAQWHTRAAWAPSKNVWYHVCADKDSSNELRVYVDGAMIASSTITQTNAGPLLYRLPLRHRPGSRLCRLRRPHCQAGRDRRHPILHEPLERPDLRPTIGNFWFANHLCCLGSRASRGPDRTSIREVSSVPLCYICKLLRSVVTIASPKGN